LIKVLLILCVVSSISMYSTVCTKSGVNLFCVFIHGHRKCKVSDIRHIICFQHTSLYQCYRDVIDVRSDKLGLHIDAVSQWNRLFWIKSRWTIIGDVCTVPPSTFITQKSHNVSTVSWSIYYSFGDRSVYFMEINIFNIQLQIFPFSPACYTPKLTCFGHVSGQKGVHVIPECVQYMEEYGVW